MAVALLDGQVYPEQLTPERINRTDVQVLLQKVKVGTVSPLHKPLPLAGLLDPYTAAYPDRVKAKIEIKLIGDRKLTKEVDDFHGFFTRPLSWEDTILKFSKLTGNGISESKKQQIIRLIGELESRSLEELIVALTQDAES